jgi:hypothetical protein
MCILCERWEREFQRKTLNPHLAPETWIQHPNRVIPGGTSTTAPNCHPERSRGTCVFPATTCPPAIPIIAGCPILRVLCEGWEREFQRKTLNPHLASQTWIQPPNHVPRRHQYHSTRLSSRAKPRDLRFPVDDIPPASPIIAHQKPHNSNSQCTSL